MTDETRPGSDAPGDRGARNPAMLKGWTSRRGAAEGSKGTPAGQQALPLLDPTEGRADRRPSTAASYPGRYLGAEPIVSDAPALARLRRLVGLEAGSPESPMSGAGSGSSADFAPLPAPGAQVPQDPYAADPFLDGLYLDDEGMRSRAGRRLRRAVRATTVSFAWLVLAVVIALGSAGIVAAIQHAPGGGSRPELTWGADQALQPTIDASLAQLQRLSTEVDALGETARLARSSLTQENRVKLQDAVNTGTQDVTLIGTDASAIASLLRCDLGVGRLETSNSAAMIDRVAQICASLDATDSLPDDWTILASASLQAMDLRDLLIEHDQVAGVALQYATKGQYANAIKQLGGATNVLVRARDEYAQLAKTTDVTTLGQWIDRSQAMDNALAALWQAMIESKGRVTKAVTDALKAVADAKNLLPPDTKYMSVVLAELASGGLNQAAISIETARGRLAAAVQGIEGAATPSSGP